MAAFLEFELNPVMAYPNVWITATMRANEYEYYGVIFVYVDDNTIVSNLGDEVVKQIGDFYKIK